MEIGDGEVIVSQAIDWLYDEEFIIETVTESKTEVSVNTGNSGTRTNTVKKEHGYKTTNGFNITGTATLTCKFRYNEDKGTVSCLSKTYKFKEGSGITMKKTSLNTVQNVGFWFVKPSVTVSLSYSFTSAIGKTSNFTLSMKCDTAGNI